MDELPSKVESIQVEVSRPEQFPAFVHEALSYFDIETLMTALTDEGYSAQREIQQLARIVQDDGAKPRDKLAAMKALRERLADALKASGVLQQITHRATVDSDGNHRLDSVSMTQTVSKMAVSEKLLQGADHDYFAAESPRLTPSPGCDGCPAQPGEPVGEEPQPQSPTLHEESGEERGEGPGDIEQPRSPGGRAILAPRPD